MLALLLRLLQLEPQTQCAVLKTVADDFKSPNLACVLDVRSNAGAYVIIANTHNAQCFTCIGRQFAQIDPGRYILACNEFNGYRQTLFNDFVHPLFNRCNLLLCRCAGQGIVALALFALNVRIAAAFTPEYPHHCLV